MFALSVASQPGWWPYQGLISEIQHWNRWCHAGCCRQLAIWQWL